MSLYDVLLFFHVLGAFSLVVGTVAMAPFALGWGAPALNPEDRARMALIGAVLSGIGAVLTIVLGLWLVGNVGYQLLRFWIIGALVLWAVAGYSNGKVAGSARNFRTTGEAAVVKTFWIIDLLGATLLLVLMIWKPGH